MGKGQREGIERNYHNSEIPGAAPRGFTDASLCSRKFSVRKGQREGIERNYHNSEIPEQPPRGFTDAPFAAGNPLPERGQREGWSGTINRR
jgi:hypothetical protein